MLQPTSWELLLWMNRTDNIDIYYKGWFITLLTQSNSGCLHAREVEKLVAAQSIMLVPPEQCQPNTESLEIPGEILHFNPHRMGSDGIDNNNGIGTLSSKKWKNGQASNIAFSLNLCIWTIIRRCHPLWWKVFSPQLILLGSILTDQHRDLPFSWF